MLAGPSQAGGGGSGSGSRERLGGADTVEPLTTQSHSQSQSQSTSTPPNQTIQLKLTTDHPDKPISRKITYDALPAWRNLCSRIVKLFGINFDAIQIIYPLENEIIVKGDDDLHAVLGSQPIAEHIFKFIVRNMHSPQTQTGNKIIVGRPTPTHNRLSTPKKNHIDVLRALDTEIPPLLPLNEPPPPPPPNVINHKPKKYRLFPLNNGGGAGGSGSGSVYNEDYLRKRAAERYNSVPLGVPFQTPGIMSHIDWPKEVPERITAVPDVGQRLPVQRSMPAPALEPVQGLDLDLGPPASGFIAPASTLEEGPSDLQMTYNNNNNNTPRPSIQIFPIPHPRIIPPPPTHSSIPELVPASMFPQIILANAKAKANADTNSLGLGHNLPLGIGMTHPNSISNSNFNLPFSPQPPRLQGNSTNHSRESGMMTSLNPPPGFIPTGRQPHHHSPIERIIDDTSDFTNPVMSISPLRLQGEEEQVSQNNNRLRRRPGEIVVIEDTSASSPNSVGGGGGGGSAGGLESLLIRNGGSGSGASISPPLGSAAIQRYLDADSDCSSGIDDGGGGGGEQDERQRPKARIHTPPISSSRTRHSRNRDPDPSSSKPKGATPTLEPSYESSSSAAPSWAMELVQKRKKRSGRIKKYSKRSSAGSVASTLQSNNTNASHQRAAPIPERPVNPFPSSSTSTKRISSISDHTAGLNNPSTTTSSATLPVPPKTVLQDPKIEDVIRVQVKDMMREAIEELKTEMQRTMSEMLRVHCSEIRERLATQASTEPSRSESQERPSYAASNPPPSSHIPPPPPPPVSGPIPQPHPSLSIPPPAHSYHPYMSLPTSTLIFPPHHPYCSDYTLPTPTFTMPYRSYVIPSATGLPSCHPGACCHVHHAMKPGDIPMESGYYHHSLPPPPLPPHVQPPPPPPSLSSVSQQQPYFFRQGRWYTTPGIQTPGGVGAAPAYSGNNLNASSSLPVPQPSVGNDVERMRNEYSEGLAKLRDIEERFNALLEGAENGKPGGEKREDPTSVPALASLASASVEKTNPESARRKESSANVGGDEAGHQRTAWENLMSYVSKPGRNWPKGD